MTKRILIVSDAWHPQVSGVVRTYTETVRTLREMGHTVEVVGPNEFPVTMPLPTYPDVRLALFPYKQLSKKIEAFKPDAIHLATEGPLGLAGRKWCKKNGYAYTTGFHTKFADYIKIRFAVPTFITLAFQRWFHNQSVMTLTSSPNVEDELYSAGFTNVVWWKKGVNTDVFNPNQRGKLTLSPDGRPIILFVGRVSVEKNLPAFCELAVDGHKVVVGDGPALPAMRKKYPHVTFVGVKHGAELAAYYANSDVFVFPSKSDTFGMVMVEALACGTPVAAYPVTGPLDVFTEEQIGKTGALEYDLASATKKALKFDRNACAAFAKQAYSWQTSAEFFLSQLAYHSNSSAE
jgi:glycosyltransferase involved in cell wall biosynthesis